jgi:hypothetical protein
MGISPPLQSDKKVLWILSAYSTGEFFLNASCGVFVWTICQNTVKSAAEVDGGQLDQVAGYATTYGQTEISFRVQFVVYQCRSAGLYLWLSGSINFAVYIGSMHFYRHRNIHIRELNPGE